MWASAQGKPMKKKKYIASPGYHLQANYDLTKLRQRKERMKKRSVDFGLSLTAMIDMFSTLVIFLLLNFSSTGEAFFINKQVTLPTATHVHPLESGPLISITDKTITLDSQEVGIKGLQVNQNLPLLSDALKKIKSLRSYKNSSQNKLQINLQADENTDVEKIKKVMTLVAQEGFSGINFAVYEGK